ncbi:hypothetical protein MKW92_010044 [Papaver armeniacum]|nr:hypothetical protein MKW92_010044 [Papaver armeniacum]
MNGSSKIVVGAQESASSRRMPPRSAFQDISQQSSAGASSPAPGYGSDSTYEASELGTPGQVWEHSSEIGTEDLDLDQDLAS